MGNPNAPLPQPNTTLTEGGRPAQAWALYFAALDSWVRKSLLQVANNLSDVANAATALANLGGMANPGAWTAYTPSLTPGSGTFGSASATGKFVQLGKTIHFTINVTITTNGTAAGFINASLPTTVNTTGVAAGRENLVTFKMLQGLFSAGTATVTIVNYDNTYPGVNGASIFVSGTYETT